MNSQIKSVTIASEIVKIDTVVNELVDFVVKHSQVEREDIAFVLSEALTNAVIHGNRQSGGKRVHAQVHLGGGRVVLKVADEGEGFDYETVPNPTRKENLFHTSGRGIFFIRHFMDEVIFNDSGNEITMIKHLS